MGFQFGRHNLLMLISLMIFSGTMLSVSSCLPEEQENLIEHAAHDPASYGDWRSKSLTERIATAPDFVADFMMKFNQMDEQFSAYKTRPYMPDAAFVEELDALVKAWPREIHEMLEDNLVGIFFVSDMGSSGFATWMANAGESYRGFILIDEQAIVQTANAWVSGRAASAFRLDPGDSLVIMMEEPENNTLTRAAEFILLHEIGHQLAFAYGVHALLGEGAPPSDHPNISSYPFFAGRWQGPSNFQAMPVDSTALAYYKLPSYPRFETDKLPFSKAVELYTGLPNTSYPTLLAGSGHAQYFAESFASYVHCIVQQRPYHIQLFRQGRQVLALDNGILGEGGAFDRAFMAQFIATKGDMPTDVSMP